jgi:hypothetical protein
MRRFLSLAALVLCSPLVPAFAQERDLRWDALSVEAHLGADGKLHVVETQAMVFTGDWNGGERRFDIRPRQGITLESVIRIDPASRREIVLQQGDLSSVDRYDWTERNLLRWRSRSPSDPPFAETAITYVLRYTLSNILQRDEERFVLDHDFAFADRSGPIERFSLDLTLDPAWKPEGVAQSRWTAGPLPPGKSFVVTVPLRFAGAGDPAALESGLSTPAAAMLGALLLVPLLILGAALLREKAVGRLDPLRPDDVTRAWLQQNVLSTRPEVVGALWDEDIGSAEVSAVLARMVAEGKVESRVSGDEMEMTLKTPRQGLEGYERELIDGLFVDGDRTSTGLIRKHYEDRGFNPAKTIEGGLKALVDQRLPKGQPIKVSRILPTLLFLAGAGVIAYAAVKNSDERMAALFLILGGLFASVLAIIGPSFWRKRKALGVTHALLALIPAAIAVGVGALLVWRAAVVGAPAFSQELQLGVTMIVLFIFGTAVNALRSRESREAIAFRKMLTAARQYFSRELQKERPSLDDAWYPYVLAFGLGRDVERWFKRFPAVSRGEGHSHSISTSGSSSTGSSTPSWSGGGGAFGGAGASGAWVTAASGLAAGVSAPSSSGSSGGGGGGGGSSGGGGGGGW